MIRSMTGFGSGRAAAGGCALRVEVAGVNGRGLSVKLRLPEALSACQPEVERRVRGRLDRGTLTVTAELTRPAGRPQVRLNATLLAAYVREFEGARRRVKSLPPPDWRTLASLPGVLEPLGDAAGPRRALLAALQKALAAFERDRDREGRSLARICGGLLDAAEGALDRAEARRQEGLAGFRDRLSERLRAALSREGLAAPVEPELRRELVLQAERSDVAEEVARLRVHLAEARRCLAARSPAGRRLDFLAQEMMREANTLGAKAVDGPLALAAVDLKTALDRFKEQVQNVE